jgi:hypothetical protein
MFCGAISSMSVGTLGGRFLVVMPLVIMIASLLALSLFMAGEKNVEQKE